MLTRLCRLHWHRDCPSILRRDELRQRLCVAVSEGMRWARLPILWSVQADNPIRVGDSPSLEIVRSMSFVEREFVFQSNDFQRTSLSSQSGIGIDEMNIQHAAAMRRMSGFCKVLNNSLVKDGVMNCSHVTWSPGQQSCPRYPEMDVRQARTVREICQ